MKKTVILLIFGLCIGNVWGQKINTRPPSVADSMTISSTAVIINSPVIIRIDTLTNIPEPSEHLPVLDISELSLSSVENPGCISSGEKGCLRFKIRNTGEGDAYNLWLHVSETNDCPGLKYANLKFIVKQFSPGETRIDSIFIEGRKNLRDGEAEFKLFLREANGNKSSVAVVSVLTREANKPNIDISNYDIYPINDKELRIQMTVKNTGSQNQKDVKVTVNHPKTVFPKGDNVKTLQLLRPDDTADMLFTFAKNASYDETVKQAFKIKLEDGNGRMFGKEEREIVLRPLRRTSSVDDETTERKKERIVTPFSPSPELYPPPRSVNIQPNKNTYALIIGNENYSQYSNNRDVPYAQKDAFLFRDYCLLTFNIPRENIILCTDATGNQMKQYLSELARRAKYDNSKNPELIIYYSGHGIIAEAKQSSAENKLDQYLIPVDASDANPDLSLSRQDIYAALNDIPIKRTSIFLDACNTKKYRGFIEWEENPEVCKGNVFVFASSSAEQSSIPYNKQEHGLFTYFLLKSIKDKKGDISYGDLFDQVKTNVVRQAGEAGEKQTPDRFVSSQAEANWKKWKFPQ